MADRYKILYGDNDFEIRRECPSNYPLITAGKITVLDDAGNTLQAAASFTVPTATTLNGATTAGAESIVYTGQTWASGDLIQIGSAGEPAERRRIVTVNTTTKVITLDRYLDFAHATGGAIAAAFWTYSLDASGTDYANLERGTILWSTFTPEDAIPFTDEFVIVKQQAAPAAIASKFRVRFPHIASLAATFTTDEWEQYENDAADAVRWDFSNRGRDITRLVNSGSLDELYMLKTAYLLALGGGSEEWAGEIVRQHDAYQERFEMFIASPFWTDDDQDNVRDDEEDADAQAPYFSGRGL